MNSQNLPESLLRNKIRTVMREFKRGELRSSSGQKVVDRKQALAIAYSEAERLFRERKKKAKKSKKGK